MIFFELMFLLIIFFIIKGWVSEITKAVKMITGPKQEPLHSDPGKASEQLFEKMYKNFQATDVIMPVRTVGKRCKDYIYNACSNDAALEAHRQMRKMIDRVFDRDVIKKAKMETVEEQEEISNPADDNEEEKYPHLTSLIKDINHFLNSKSSPLPLELSSFDKLKEAIFYKKSKDEQITAMKQIDVLCSYIILEYKSENMSAKQKNAYIEGLVLEIYSRFVDSRWGLTYGKHLRENA